jgi:hypothetical protein
LVKGDKIMAVALDVLNFRYDDTNPAFTDTGSGFYLHWVEGKMYDKPSFDAWLAAEGKSFGAKELGKPSAAYLKDHRWGGLASGTAPAPASAPITVAVTKAPATTADDVGKITLGGGPADKGYTINIAVKDAASTGEDVQNVSIAKGDTAAQAATKLAAGVSDPNITATASGVIVTLKPKSGSNFTKLTVAIS